MQPNVLFFITSDPRVSARPAEALRMAAGISAWDRVRVAVLLHGPAALALGPGREDLVEGDTLAQCLPLLPRHACPIYVRPGDVPEAILPRDAVPFELIDDARLGNLAAGYRYTLRF